MDYMIMGFVQFFYKADLAFSCATEKFEAEPVFKNIMRSAGAFFIDREKLKNPVYRVVLKEYFQTLLDKKVSIEHFAELKRSRAGKIRKVNHKILDFIF